MKNLLKKKRLFTTWRVEQGFQSYEKSEGLCKIVNDRIDDGDYKNHQFLLEKYSKYPSVLSENKTGAFSEKNALDRWLSSPPHRAALEKPYKYSCIATKDDYAVQIFSNCEASCP